MQSNKQITDTSKQTVKQALLDAQDNVNALRSSNSGTSFPSDPIAGMHCYRTDTKKMYMYDGSNWIEEVDVNNSQQIGGTKTFTGMLEVTNYSPDTFVIPMAVQCPKLDVGQGIYINLGKEGSQYNRYSFGFHFMGDHSTDNYFSFSSYSGPSYNFDCAGNASIPKSLTAPILNASTLNISEGAYVPTANADNNSKTVANTAFVKTAIANLVNGAPSQLDALKELSAALGNDANFSATVAKQIGEKVSKNGDTITGPILYEKTPNDGAELINKDYVDSAIKALRAEMKTAMLALFPVGTILETTNSANPSTYIGGTWEQLDAGLTTITAGTYTETHNVNGTNVTDTYVFTAGSSEFTVNGTKTQGEAKHQITEGELANVTGTVGPLIAWMSEKSQNGCLSATVGGTKFPSHAEEYCSDVTVNISFGKNQPHNNLPPLYGVYRFKRTT